LLHAAAGGAELCSKERYSYGPEYLEHCQRIGAHFRLSETALFGTIRAVTALGSGHQALRIATDRRRRYSRQVPDARSGPYNRARLPRIAGINSFKGRSFQPVAGLDMNYTLRAHHQRLDKLPTSGCDHRHGRNGDPRRSRISRVGPSNFYGLPAHPFDGHDRGNRRTIRNGRHRSGHGLAGGARRNYIPRVYEADRSRHGDLIRRRRTEINRNLAAPALLAMGPAGADREQYGRCRE